MAERTGGSARREGPRSPTVGTGIGAATDAQSPLRERISRSLRQFRTILVDDRALRHAAVAIAVHHNSEGQEGIWVIERAAGMRDHPGQYALPGGRVEPGETVIEAALRELAEELGVALNACDVLGRLDDYVTAGGYLISPIVCWVAGSPAVRPNRDEVASVHFLSFDELLRTDPRFVPHLDSGKFAIEFSVLGVTIHAPTGALLHQFADVVLRGHPTRVAGFYEPSG